MLSNVMHSNISSFFFTSESPFPVRVRVRFLGTFKRQVGGLAVRLSVGVSGVMGLVGLWNLKTE